MHFGSLVAALGSYLSVRRRGGRWLVRIEDLDTPRNVTGAADAILRDLERLAMPWDGQVVRQSRRIDAYSEALDSLAAGGWTFACGCSRRDLAGGIYPGTCREGVPSGRTVRSVRLCVPGGSIGFHDAIQGRTTQRIDKDVGDFVVRRADGIIAYHLAVVVDDAAQRVSEVVRGCDLLESTPRQILIQRALGLLTPEYAHLPVVADAGGYKLSKQNLARPIASEPPGPVLVHALDFLGQRPPRELVRAPASEVVAWAVVHWDPSYVPRRCTAPAPGYAGGSSEAGCREPRSTGTSTGRTWPSRLNRRRGAVRASSRPRPSRPGRGRARRRTGSRTGG